MGRAVFSDISYKRGKWDSNSWKSYVSNIEELTEAVKCLENIAESAPGPIGGYFLGWLEKSLESARGFVESSSWRAKEFGAIYLSPGKERTAWENANKRFSEAYKKFKAYIDEINDYNNS